LSHWRVVLREHEQQIEYAHFLGRSIGAGRWLFILALYLDQNTIKFSPHYLFPLYSVLFFRNNHFFLPMPMAFPLALPNAQEWAPNPEHPPTHSSITR